MGSDKALLEIDGVTLLEKAVKLCSCISQDILISSNNPAHAIEPYSVVPDVINNCGPIGGIYSCLERSKTDWNFVISVDSPFVLAEFVEFLFSKVGNYDAVVPVVNNKKEPLIAWYHKNSLFEIEKMLDSGNYKMHDLIKTIKTNFVDVQNWIEKYPLIFQNINRPEDL